MRYRLAPGLFAYDKAGQKFLDEHYNKIFDIDLGACSNIVEIDIKTLCVLPTENTVPKNKKMAISRGSFQRCFEEDFDDL